MRGRRAWRRRGARQGRGGMRRAWRVGAGRRCGGGTPAASSPTRRPRAARGSRARTAPLQQRRPRQRIRSWHESQRLPRFVPSRPQTNLNRLPRSLPAETRKKQKRRKRRSGRYYHEAAGEWNAAHGDGASNKNPDHPDQIENKIIYPWHTHGC